MDTHRRETASYRPIADDEVDARAQIRALTDEVADLEAAWHAGRRPPTLSSCKAVGTPALRIREIYCSLTGSPRPYRRLAVGQIIGAVAGVVGEPARRFEARGVVRPSCLPDPVGPWRLTGATVEVDGENPLTLRRGQLCSTRSWSIGLRFSDPMATRLYATALLRAAIHELTDALRSLSAIDREVRPTFGGRLAPAVGRHFEQLVLDLLNWERSRAVRADLADDLLDKTDLWFELSPGHQARVQVSLLADPALHDRKLRRIPWREELVIVTPRTLAAALLGPGGNSLLGDGDRAALLQAGGESPNLEGLAFWLHDCFKQAIARRCEHPLGPAALVPLPVARLIGRFVEREAPFAWRAHEARKQAEAEQRPALAA
ncbi:MAG: hypothetical protein ACYDCL_00520 [Myxococcales bacterium]